MVRDTAGPAIAAQPRWSRGSSDLFRLLPYLMPYRVRWIAMIVVALVSLMATIAIPLMTKAVIDGPVRHQDQRGLWTLGVAALAVGVAEAVLWFIRRWLVARATMGVEADIRKDLYARLQILPMSFHGRWQSGQLLSRVMNDLATIRRLLSFGLVFLLLNVIQITVVTAILLAMYWPLGVVVLVSIVPITLTVLHFEREFTRLSRQAQDQSGVRGHARGGSARWACGWSSRSAASSTSSTASTSRRRRCTAPRCGRSRCRPSSGRCSRSFRTSR